jgi:REP element-mobilizing transposase RayT
MPTRLPLRAIAAINSSRRTCQWLAEAIDEARTQHDFALWAYVFMPEHVHLIIYPRRDQESRAAWVGGTRRRLEMVKCRLA